MSGAREERFPYPRQLVVGLFHSEREMEIALDALGRQGFEPDRWEVLHGKQDARSLDPEGEAHGLGGKLIRALQTVLGYEHEHAREYAKRLEAGEYVVGAFVGNDERDKRRAAEAMRSSGGEFVHYYADIYIESL